MFYEVKVRYTKQTGEDIVGIVMPMLLDNLTTYKHTIAKK